MGIGASRYDSVVISSFYKTSHLREIGVKRVRKVCMPTEESFSYILDMARTGNEMAAVQLYEWHRFCKPGNIKEQHILMLIEEAVCEMFV